jgi:hypothetical protein
VIIDIALGIVLAVIILRLLPLIVAGAFLVVVVAVVLAVVIAVGVFVYKKPGEVMAIVGAVAALAGFAWGCGKLDRWLNKRFAIELGEIFALVLGAIFALVALAAMIQAILEVHGSDSVGSALGWGVMLVVIAAIAAALIQTIRGRRRTRGMELIAAPDKESACNRVNR